MKRLSEDDHFTLAKEYFLFKTLEEMKENVVESWCLFDGMIKKLY